jgi:oxygen-independent coproporphyrinogen-3 oxidase
MDFNEHQLPYPQREAVPLYFYPFLSPLSCGIGPDEVNDFFSQLPGDRVFKGRTLLYIHIPFCRNICYFCGFYRDPIGESAALLKRYVDILKREIAVYAGQPYARNREITAIYFGGGTPSLLGPELIEELLVNIRGHFPVKPGTELSFEGEVRTLKDKKRLKVLRKLGCTRVSFGVQTFNVDSRKLSGLTPTLEDIEACIKNLREFGYDINLDLMYGLPGQSFAVWKQDIEKALQLGSANIDIYDTVLYPHTILFKRRAQLKEELPGQHERIKMLDYAIDQLSAAGYIQETVEDFARPGKAYFMKKLVYGGGDGKSEIISLGAAAVGLINGFSYRNLPPGDYIEWSQNEKKVPVQLLYRMNREDFYKRALVFFPKVLGLDKEDVDGNWLERQRATIEGMKAKGLIWENAARIELTRKGLLWTDNMAMDFLQSREQRKIWKIGY